MGHLVYFDLLVPAQEIRYGRAQHIQLRVLSSLSIVFTTEYITHGVGLSFIYRLIGGPDLSN